MLFGATAGATAPSRATCSSVNVFAGDNHIGTQDEKIIVGRADGPRGQNHPVAVGRHLGTCSLLKSARSRWYGGFRRVRRHCDTRATRLSHACSIPHLRLPQDCACSASDLILQSPLSRANAAATTTTTAPAKSNPSPPKRAFASLPRPSSHGARLHLALLTPRLRTT